MPDSMRETRLAAALVKLTDALVADYDLVEVLQTLVETSAELFHTEAAGLMLKDSSGTLQVLSSTTDDANLGEIAQLASTVGPCWDCASTGVAVTVADIAAAAARWPMFSAVALQHGFRSAHATPLRLRGEVVGTLNLFDTKVGTLNEQDVAAAQALSDVATIGILSERVLRERDVVSSLLQGALESGILVERAKGVIGESAGLSMENAFRMLRAYSRSSHLTLPTVSSAIINRSLTVSTLIGDAVHRHATRPGPPATPGRH